MACKLNHSSGKRIHLPLSLTVHKVHRLINKPLLGLLSSLTVLRLCDPFIRPHGVTLPKTTFVIFTSTRSLNLIFHFYKCNVWSKCVLSAMFHASAHKMAYFRFLPHLLGFQTAASFKGHLHVVATLKRRKDSVHSFQITTSERL